MLANRADIIESIAAVTKVLGDLHQQVVFVGGAVAGFYIDDPGAPEIRPTKDLDFVVEIASEMELEAVRQALLDRGFQHNPNEKVICRFYLGDLPVDVMATKAIGWAPANPWFKAGFDRSLRVQLMDTEIRIMPFPYFLA